MQVKINEIEQVIQQLYIEIGKMNSRVGENNLTNQLIVTPESIVNDKMDFLKQQLNDNI